MGAEAATPSVGAGTSDTHECDCGCDAAGEVQRVMTADGAVEVGDLCRRCRKDFWRVTS